MIPEKQGEVAVLNKIEIKTEQAPAVPRMISQGLRIGPYVQASHGPADPATGEFVSLGDVRAQTVRTLLNLEAILEAGGATFRDVVMVRAYLTDRDHYGPMNEAYQEFFAARRGDEPFPARTCVFPHGLPSPDMLVELDMLAVVDD